MAISKHINCYGDMEHIYEVGQWLEKSYGKQANHTWEAFVIEMDDYNNCPGIVRLDFHDKQIYMMFALKWL